MSSLFDKAFAGFADPQKPNVLRDILAAQNDAPLPIPQVNTDLGVPLPDVPQMRPKRPKVSLLDLVGGLSDTVAEIGGVAPQYQPTLDAMEARRQMQAQQEMERQKFDMQRRLGEQQLQSGEFELQNAREIDAAQALAALDGVDNATELFGQIAPTVGVPPELAQQIQQKLALGIPPSRLAAAMGFRPEPSRTGTPAKELQIYSLLAQSDPALAEQFLTNLAQGGNQNQGLTPYQREQLDLRRKQLELQRQKYLNPPLPATVRTKQAQGQAEKAQYLEAFKTNLPFFDKMERAIEDMKESGAILAPGQSVVGRIGTTIGANVPFVEGIANRKAKSARERFESLRMGMLSVIEPLIRSASGGGVNISARMLDSAKEIENQLRSIASATDYEAAKETLDLLKKRYTEVMRGLEQEMKGDAPVPSRQAPPTRRASPSARRAPNPALEAELRRRGLI